VLRRKVILAAVGVAVLAGAAAATAAIAPIKEYAVPLTSEYSIKKIISSGDTVPETSDPTKQYQMVGIPDGLGAHDNGDGTATVYMNHELTGTTLSEPVLGDPLNGGALVSKLIIDEDGTVVSGERAYDTVYAENVFVGLDTLGGVTVAIFDNELHTLPKLGRFAWENTLVQPNHGNRTVIMGMEDGPAALDPAVENSQVYMYVGKKDRRAGASVLRRNGLKNGTLYVLAPVDPADSSEAAFAGGTIEVEWVEIPNAGTLSEAQLEVASDVAGVIRFVARPEDGAFNKRNRDEFFFVTTGGAAGANELGRLYSLRIHPGNPTKNGELAVVYNADEVIDDGGDIAISPDNIDTSDDYLMINEDGTTESRLVMADLGRDGSIWRFDVVGGRVGVDVTSAVRVAELDPPGRDGAAVGPGVWETSGIIDGSRMFGENAWLFDVQAHSPTAAPAPNTVEDGQLLLLLPSDD
jgi:hypothetical protein